MKALAGVLLVVAHVALFAVALDRCTRADLAVTVRGPNASPVLALDGELPPDLDVAITDVPGPGLARRTWSTHYRGGFVRSVGAAQLVGPFQDPAARACTGRVVVAQRFLDAIAGELTALVTEQLRGESIWPAGDFRRVTGTKLAWARLEWHPWDRGFVGEAPHGYVRAELALELDRVSIPVVIALVPSVATTELAFRVATRAELDFDNRVAQWLSDKLGGNAFATSIAQGQVDGLLVSALAPPPPFELEGGQTLTFGFCGEPPEIVEGKYGALPFAVELGRVPADPAILPPRLGPAPRLPIADGATLAIDLDLDALNALLYELWRGGFLDRELLRAGLHDRFNTDPLVTELLSIRLSPLRLALPPVVSAIAETGTHRLHLAADGRATIADGEARTVGRVWGGLDFTFGAGIEPVGVDLSALELSCERAPSTLVPCYADLVAAMRDRTRDFHGALTQTFATLLSEIFVERRLSDSALPAELVIQRAVPRLTTSGRNGSLHLDLEATLHSTREPR